VNEQESEVDRRPKKTYFCTLNYFTATQNPRNIMTDQQVLMQLQQLPDNLKQEVSDFIGYLLAKYKKVAATPQPPEQKRFSKYRGSLKSGLSVEEIDAQLTKLREEWERSI
jgi:hypothetical protein